MKWHTVARVACTVQQIHMRDTERNAAVARLFPPVSLAPGDTFGAELPDGVVFAFAVAWLPDEQRRLALHLTPTAKPPPAPGALFWTDPVDLPKPGTFVGVEVDAGIVLSPDELAKLDEARRETGPFLSSAELLRELGVDDE